MKKALVLWPFLALGFWLVLGQSILGGTGLFRCRLPRCHQVCRPPRELVLFPPPPPLLPCYCDQSGIWMPEPDQRGPKQQYCTPWGFIYPPYPMLYTPCTPLPPLSERNFQPSSPPPTGP
jgi:hypothetical protein